MFKLGLIGQSLSHTLSPKIHQAFFDELGLSGRYDTIEIPEASMLSEKIEALIQADYCGFNVTIPYKLDVFQSLRHIDESAAMAGAVNTIKCGDSFQNSHGFNTDSSGLAEALFKLDLDGAGGLVEKKTAVLILGSGGAARAAIVAVSALGFEKLVVCGRNISRIETMLEQVGAAANRASVKRNCAEAEIWELGDESSADIGITRSSADIGLALNATPIGQKNDSIPAPISAILKKIAKARQDAAFVDLVYSSELTPLCQLAREAGFKQVEDGKEMLLNQARLAFKIWTGHLPDGQLARERLKNSGR